MKIEQARDEFAVRFYRWAQASANQEIDDGFPLLSSIRGRYALRMLKLCSTMTVDEVKHLIQLYVKSNHPRAIELTGEYLTIGDEKLLEDAHQSRMQPTAFELEVSRAKGEGTSTIQTLNRRRFVSRAMKQLSPLLGKEVEQMRSGQWRWFVSPVGSWKLNTTLHLGAPTEYKHFIWAAPNVGLYEYELISMANWLGVVPVWDLILSDAEGDAAIESMSIACSKFLNAAPLLLQGLSHEYPSDSFDNWPTPPRQQPVRIIKKAKLPPG